METVGFFGKVPAARDFVFHGLSARVTEAWAGFVSDWLSQARENAGPDWTQAVLRSPVWRFLLPEGIPDCGIAGAAGLMAGSVDGAGRVFPFSVMLLTGGPGTPLMPDAALDAAMDEIEPLMLGFMEAQHERDLLLATLEAARSGFTRRTRTMAETQPHLREDEAAAIMLGGEPAWHTVAATEAFCLPSAAAGGQAECHWWHDGLGETMGSQYLVSRGIPTGPAAAPLFHGNWRSLWQPRAKDGM
ncbi:type VI secretion system ImpM family protein [Pseudorhizobium tarimense]|uniref:Type VI secretion system ImpM family protein n=1 Tax=Pseudorhizobium tarimense TaxID=1079109 RepID=A0ABV2H492_9HYPH|nr:type VI secretion system-associated protein TagF [Pseudorhizobium tarimense]MCJ8518551.1 type VI secretion system-associated protein TagF [Pseudorhizobium tarimense]